MEQTYKVTYAIDYLDTDPTIKYFDCFEEAQEWLQEEVSNRVQWTVDHSPYSINQEELDHIQETEYSLVEFSDAIDDIVKWFQHFTKMKYQEIIDHVAW